MVIRHPAWLARYAWAGSRSRRAGIGVDFQGGAGLRGDGKDAVPVEISTFSALDQPPRRMGNDVDVRVLKDAYQPRGQFVSWLAQPGVKRGDDDVEACQRLVVEIERAVSVNLDLRAGQESTPVSPFASSISIRCRPKPFGVEPSRDRKTLAVIGDAQQAVAAGRRSVRHFSHGRGAVAPRRMGMKLAVDVCQRHQRRDLSEALELLAARSKLRRNEGKSAARIDLLLGRRLLGNGSQAARDALRCRWPEPASSPTPRAAKGRYPRPAHSPAQRACDCSSIHSTSVTIARDEIAAARGPEIGRADNEIEVANGYVPTSSAASEAHRIVWSKCRERRHERSGCRQRDAERRAARSPLHGLDAGHHCRFGASSQPLGGPHPTGNEGSFERGETVYSEFGVEPQGRLGADTGNRGELGEDSRGYDQSADDGRRSCPFPGSALIAADMPSPMPGISRSRPSAATSATRSG